MKNGTGIRTGSCEKVADDHSVAFSSWCNAKVIENERYRAEATSQRTPHEIPLIVLVDDELVVAVTLTEILRRHGLNVLWFTEPLCALAYFESVQVELLISDITMPQFDGVQLAARIRNVQPSCQILLFSAVCGQSEVLERIARLKVDAHLESKPLNMPCLISTINRLLSGASCSRALLIRQDAIGSEDACF
jgi:response regulator RpfG family c-di-GMP phosphodiesterase